jgi:hypothetical protein
MAGRTACEPSRIGRGERGFAVVFVVAVVEVVSAVAVHGG